MVLPPFPLIILKAPLKVDELCSKEFLLLQHPKLSIFPSSPQLPPPFPICDQLYFGKRKVADAQLFYLEEKTGVTWCCCITELHYNYVCTEMAIMLPQAVSVLILAKPAKHCADFSSNNLLWVQSPKSPQGTSTCLCSHWLSLTTWRACRWEAGGGCSPGCSCRIS